MILPKHMKMPSIHSSPTKGTNDTSTFVRSSDNDKDQSGKKDATKLAYDESFDATLSQNATGSYDSTGTTSQGQRESDNHFPYGLQEKSSSSHQQWGQRDRQREQQEVQDKLKEVANLVWRAGQLLQDLQVWSPNELSSRKLWVNSFKSFGPSSLIQCGSGRFGGQSGYGQSSLYCQGHYRGHPGFGGSSGQYGGGTPHYYRNSCGQNGGSSGQYGGSSGQYGSGYGGRTHSGGGDSSSPYRGYGAEVYGTI